MPRWSVDVPAVLIGLTVAAYWYRVLRMAKKARKKTGRAANLVPPEPLGKMLRLLWAPAIAVWIVHPLIPALSVRPPMVLRPLWQNPAASWVGAIIVVLGFVATRVCWARMGAAWRMGIDPGERNSLIVSGPFAYVRHPIYGLSCVMMFATVVSLPSPLMIGAGVVHFCLLIWESCREERHLLRVHGKPYRRYMEHVGRFLPLSARPYAGACNVQAGAGVD